MFKDFTKWMDETATVLFDDTKNDLRALPKTVRLTIKICSLMIYELCLKP